MSGGHGFTHHHLQVHRSSRVHRLPPEAKLVGLVAFVVLVALTPRDQVAAFALHAAVAGAVVAAARLRPPLVFRRLAAIVPFVGFAFLLPFIGDGATTEVGPLTLSIDGLWAAWNIVAKASLGATAGIVLTATTTIPEILGGLARLRVPAAIVGITGFMFRYLDLIVDDLARMRRAMVARGHDPRWLWQARPIASSAGVVFVRTYERGERIHGAMTARGFTGTMPPLDPATPRSRRDWFVGLVPALTSAAGLLAIRLA